MGSHLTNPTSAIDDDYLIRRTNGVELVGDNDDCRRLPQLGHSGLDMGLVLRVQSRGGLVEKQNRGAFEQGPSYRHPLTFATRKPTTPFSDAGIPTARKTISNLVDTGQGSGLTHVLIGGVRATDADIFRQGGVIEVHILKHHGKLTHELLSSLIADIDPTNSHRSGISIPEPGNEPKQSGLASARGSDDSRQSAGRNSERDVVEDRASLVVAERDTFKTHLAGGGKPHRDVWLGKHSSREDLVDLGDRFTRSLDGQGRSTDILQHLRVAQRNPDESHRHDRVQRPDPPRFAASTMRVTAMPWAVNPKTKLANTPSHRSLRAARLLATWASWRG